MRTLLKLVTLLLLCSTPSLMAGVVLEPIPAPEWEVSAWLNDDPGALRDHRGQVVLIEFFQLWCPGSREFSVPLLRRWSTLYGDREDVVIVLIHSVFEGHEYQTPERLRAFVRENGIAYPLGVDVHDDADEDVPVTMHRYQTGGTPHVAIVDKEGMLRFTHFGIFDPEPIEGFIERLLKESPGARDPVYVRGSGAGLSPPAPEAGLAGTYLFRTEPASGACATWVPRMETTAELRFYRDAIDIEFEQPFLDMRALTALYDPQTGRLEGESEQSAVGGVGSKQLVRLEGVLGGEAGPPELEFELSLLGGKCTVQGRAVRQPQL